MGQTTCRIEVPAPPAVLVAGAAWSWTARASDPRLLDPVGVVWRWVPPGRFRMGARGYYADEEPTHDVEVGEGFWILETPVTQAQWLAVHGGESPAYEQGPPDWREHPVERVTWPMARDWCAELERVARKTLPVGGPIGLPSEVQWEYACRAGSHSEFCNGDGEECLARVGWFAGNSGGRSHPVGRKDANAWGLYDMHGNVNEWCSDVYVADAYERAVEGRGDEDKSQSVVGDTAPRVIRGGSCAFQAVFCRSAYRFWGWPDHDFVDGFRACLFPGSGTSLCQ